MTVKIETRQARTEDAREIADLHIVARRISMPYLREPFTEDETRAWFARAVGDRSEACWVAHHAGQIVGYMFLDRQYLDHLYVRSDWQGRGTLLSSGTAMPDHFTKLVAFILSDSQTDRTMSMSPTFNTLGLMNSDAARRTAGSGHQAKDST